jgi:hypothetical protein
VSWEGEVVWEYVNRAQHHDFFRLANGNTLFPEWVELPEDLHKRVRGGFKMPKERLPRLLGDDLVEIDRNLREVRRIHTWQLLDVREDRIRPQTRRWEWTHINGIDVNDAGDIVFSARNIDKVVRINHATGQIDWKFDKTHGQHHPTFGDDGRVMVFDNGHDASRVIEIDTKTNEIVWQYSGTPMHQFFSGHISGASRLASGNVLVCEGTAGRLFEVNRESQVVWEFINPFSNQDRRKQPSVSVYRAHRYGVDHPALVDRDLDPERHRNLNRLHGLM